MSNYAWNIKTKGSLIYIENTEKNKVLELQISSGFDYYSYEVENYELIEEDFVEDNPNQLWKKVEPYEDTEGYFFLENSGKVLAVLTATTASTLEIAGV